MSDINDCRPIPFAPGYEVDRFGTVYSTQTNWRGYGRRQIKTVPDRKGYRRIRLVISGNRKRFFVHHIVVLVFHGPKPSPSHMVRHLDGNHLNNSAENLKWGTAKENSDDRDLHGRTPRKEKHWAAKLTSEIVREIRSSTDGGTTIARRYGIHKSTVYAIRHHRNWKNV